MLGTPRPPSTTPAFAPKAHVCPIASQLWILSAPEWLWDFQAWRDLAEAGFPTSLFQMEAPGALRVLRHGQAALGHKDGERKISCAN